MEKIIHNADALLRALHRRFILLSGVILLVSIGTVFAYDRHAAIAYIDMYWNTVNRDDYYDYDLEGGDCANFGSQVLIAGGIRFRPFGPFDTTFEQNNPGIHVEDYGTIIRAEELRYSLKTYHGAVETSVPPFNLRAGDIVFLLNPDTGKAFHTTIVRQIIDGAFIYVAAHSGPRSGAVEDGNWLEGFPLGNYQKAYLHIPDSPVAKEVRLTQGGQIIYQAVRRFVPDTVYIGQRDPVMIPEINYAVGSGRIDARILFDNNIHDTQSPVMTYGLTAPFTSHVFGNWRAALWDEPRDLWYADINKQVPDGNYTMSIDAYGKDATRMDSNGNLEVYNPGPYAQLTFNVVDPLNSLDVTPPPAPGVYSDTHPDPNQSYINNGPQFGWNTPSDPSGIAGFSWILDQNALTAPDSISDGLLNQFSFSNVSAGTWYFHIRARDDAGNWGETAHFRINIAPPPDTTPPAMPVVTDDGIATDNPTQLHASWISQDPESGIAEYLYAVGATAGGEDVIPFTSAGANTSITRTGLNLAKGLIYYFSVKAKNGAGLFSEIGTSDGILVNNSRPVADAGGPYSTVVGKPVAFDGTASSDPDGDMVSYQWDFGDGTTGIGSQPVHTYTSNGNFTVTLMVNDGKVNSQTASATINVGEFKGASAIWTTSNDFAGGITDNTEIVLESTATNNAGVNLMLGPEKLIIDQLAWDRKFPSNRNSCISIWPYGTGEIRASFYQSFNIVDGFMITKFAPLITVDRPSIMTFILSEPGVSLETFSFDNSILPLYTATFAEMHSSIKHPLKKGHSYIIRDTNVYCEYYAYQYWMHAHTQWGALDVLENSEGFFFSSYYDSLVGIGSHPDWTFKIYGRQYENSGKYISAAFDVGDPHASWGPFTVLQTTSSGNISYFTQTSADGVNWEAEKPIIPGYFIQSSPNKFIRWVAQLQTDDRSITPAVDEVKIYFREYVPPSSPDNLLADGSTSTWKNVKEYNISWTGPSDVSGIAGARVKFDGTAPVSNDEGIFFLGQSSVIYSNAEIVNGRNGIWVWLEDNAGNAAPATAVQLTLRYDNIPPVSTANAPVVSSAPPIPMNFNSSDEGAPETGSGISKTVLWSRYGSEINWSSSSYGLTGSSGVFAFNADKDGNCNFYAQSYDTAGNSEPVPVSTTPAKAATFVDVSAPVISNIKAAAFSPDSAVIEWTTDDETTAVIDYGRTASLGSRFTEVVSGKTHSITLTGLPNPADIYFKITATNRTGLTASSAVNSFKTPLNINYDTDIFGVIDYTQPVTLYITNPDVSSATFVVNGQTWSGAVSTSTPVQIYVDPSVTGGGAQTVNVSADGYEYSSSFVVDTATRTVKLARLVVSAGGVMTSTAVIPGDYVADMTTGQEAQEEMSSGESKLFLGYYAGIDPVAPAAISDLAATAGPEAGQVSLAWTAPGDDANVGTAMKYELRYSTEPMTLDNFALALPVSNAPLPQKTGIKQQMTVSGLSDGTAYYFALKVLDELMNFSLSNCATVQTLQVAQSTTLINNQPAVKIVSTIPGIEVVQVSTAVFNPALVIATAAAQNQGLVFFSDIYEITPSMQLSGGATVQFRYEDPGPDVERDLAVYRYDPALPQWVMLAGVIDADNNIITALTYIFSMFAVFVRDTKPPLTELVFEGGSLYRDVFGDIYISSRAFLGFKAEDPVLGAKPGSGVKETGYKIDSLITPFIPFAGPFLPGEGFHSVQYRSVDNAGNIEQAKQMGILVDASAPVINFKIDKATGTFEDKVIVPAVSCMLTVSAFDPLVKGAASGVRYTSVAVNGEDVPAGEAGFIIELASGVYRITASAEDYVGNKAENKIDVIVGDITPPVVLISSPTAGAVFTATKDKIEVYFSVRDDFDASPRYEAYLTEIEDKGSARGERPLRVLVSSHSLIEPLDIDDGIWRLAVSATDFARNSTAAVSGLFEVVHDTLAPRTELTLSGMRYAVSGMEYIRKDTELKLSSIDDLVQAGDGIGLGVRRQAVRLKAEGSIVKELTFENPEPKQGQIFVSTFTLAGAADGIYGLAYNAEDIIGNIGEVKISTYALDNTPPETAYMVEGAGYRIEDGIIYISERNSIALTAADPVINGVSAGVSSTVFKIDEGDFVQYISSITLAEGRHKIAYYSSDRLGNLEPAKTLNVYMDATPPVTSLTAGGAYYIPRSGPNAGDWYAAAWFAYKLSAYDPVVKDVSSGLFYSEYLIIPLAAFGTKPVEPTPQELGRKFTPFDYSDPLNSFGLAEGINRVDYRSYDNVLNAELRKTTTVYVDATPPVSQFVFISSYSQRADGLILSSVSPLTISAADPLIKGVASGVRASYFLHAGGEYLTWEYNPYTGAERVIPWYLPKTQADGYVDLQGFSGDNTGNNEASFAQRVVLDNTPPAAFIISPSASVSNPGLCKLVGGTDIKIIGSVSDKGTHSDGKEFDHFSSYTLEFGYGADPSNFTVIVSSQPGLSLEAETLGVWDPAGLPEGVYTLRLRAKDSVGNEAVATAQIIISQPKLLLSLGSRGSGTGQFNSPSYIAIDPRNSEFWVSDTNNDRIEKFTSSGTYITELASWEAAASGGGKGKGKGGGKTIEKFNKPTGVAVDANGHLWVADRNNDRVVKFDSVGKYLLTLEAGLNKPHGLAADTNGNLWAADRNNDAVKKFSSDGNLLLTINTGIGEDFNKPQGVIAVDYLDRIYITDRNNDRVLIYDSSGTFLKTLGNGSGSGAGQFNKPDGIAVNALAYAYVADTNNSRVQKFDPYGNLVMIFDRASNDAEPFNHPGGLAVDAGGNLFVVDSNNAKVKKFGAEGELVLIASQEDGGQPQGAAGTSAARLVAKAVGGKVHHPKGITVDIPADALGSDAEITITVGYSVEGKGYRAQGAGRGKKLTSITEAVEFGPDGAVFDKPVTISIPYDPARLAAGVSESELAIFWLDPSRQEWEELPSTVDTRLKVVSAQTTHFSLYTVMALAVGGAEFALGEVYVFPNPAKGTQIPTFHIEAGIAERLTIKIYTVSGRLAHEAALTGLPQIIDDGHGSEYAYEYAWNGNIPSGVYYYFIEAEKAGQKLKKTGKFAVIR